MIIYRNNRHVRKQKQSHNQIADISESILPMTFISILYPKSSEGPQTTQQMPSFFPDLNLDQVVDAINKGKQEYNLACFYYENLQEKAAITYRQDVFRDLENEEVFNHIDEFATKMILVRRYLGVAEKSYYAFHKMGWHLEAAITYCDAVDRLNEGLSQSELKSSGLMAFLKWLGQYQQSTAFQQFNHEVHDLKNKLGAIQYNVIIKSLSVRVRKYEGEQDYSQAVVNFFSKFKQGEVKNFTSDLTIAAGMNHVEAKILDFVAKLFPEPFEQLTQFKQNYSPFIADTIQKFDREIQFYVAYLLFIKGIKARGLPFCYPKVNPEHKSIRAEETFDIALAEKYRIENQPIICNDFYLEGDERIFIVSGANQGGKTTFSRMIGQVHHLASLGCPVPGKTASLFLFDQIFTHFEKEEAIQNLRGKLKDDLVRIHRILDQATGRSIIIMNEIFTSTSLQDALFLSKKILEKIMALDAISVCVTFIDELSTLGKQTVSMVSTVEPDNPANRTFKIIRKPADGRAYALDVARQHQLTYDLIKERIDR